LGLDTILRAVAVAATPPPILLLGRARLASENVLVMVEINYPLIEILQLS
jgi:hypothetical protein